LPSYCRSSLLFSHGVIGLYYKVRCSQSKRSGYFLALLSVAAPELYAADKTSLEPSRDSIIHIVTQIQRADYEGDRPALKRLHDDLSPIPKDNKLASQVLYWRGFALWRRAINGL